MLIKNNTDQFKECYASLLACLAIGPFQRIGNVRDKSFIIQGFEDFCGVSNADLRLPLR